LIFVRPSSEGSVLRRSEEEWVQAERRHKALIPDEWFERAAAGLTKRRQSEGSRRPSQQRRSYLLRGIVHCATGHNPLRMHGKERKGITYYACSYRISYGDKAAEALGHGTWQYVREDLLLEQIDRFFTTHVFAEDRLTRFRPELDGSRNGEASIDVDDACAVLDGLPDLGDALARAEPELRRRVFDAFRLSVAIDKNAAQIPVKALVSSAFTKARDLQSLVANESIAGAGFGQTSTTAYRLTEVRQL